ncbi:MAG: hypothetical protein AAFP70_15050, partial [Calditrichota bacterium]
MRLLFITSLSFLCFLVLGCNDPMILMNDSENIRVIPLHNADELGLKGCGVLISKRLFEGFRIEPYRLA